MAEFGKDAGKRLRTARERLGLSQFEAAVKLGVTDKTVGKWERGVGKPTRLNIWRRIEEVYGVTTAEILGEPEPAQLDRIEQMLQQLLAAINQPDEAPEPEQPTPLPTLPSQRTKAQGSPVPRRRRAS